MAELLASGTTAANSSDFTLADGQTATLFLKNGNSSGGVVAMANVQVQIKSADGYYYEFDRLNDRKQILFLEAPGTYRVRRLASDNSYGVDYVTAGLVVQGSASATGLVVGGTANPSANFTRPGDTNPYASGDQVANSTTAGSVTPMSFTVGRVAAGGFRIFKARLRKSGTGVTNAAFSLHLFTASPTVTNGDNGVFLPNQAASYIGRLDCVSMTAFSDGAVGNAIPAVGFDMGIKLASGQTIYGLMEAKGAYTPSSAEVFTWTLEEDQD